MKRLWLGALALGLVTLAPTPARASHFRGASCSYQLTEQDGVNRQARGKSGEMPRLYPAISANSTRAAITVYPATGRQS